MGYKYIYKIEFSNDIQNENESIFMKVHAMNYFDLKGELKRYQFIGI